MEESGSTVYCSGLCVQGSGSTVYCSGLCMEGSGSTVYCLGLCVEGSGSTKRYPGTSKGNTCLMNQRLQLLIPELDVNILSDGYGLVSNSYRTPNVYCTIFYLLRAYFFVASVRLFQKELTYPTGRGV